jgi:hypothetical protein
MTNAYMTMGANTAIGLYLQGQTASTLKNLNGLPKSTNDGTNAGGTVDLHDLRRYHPQRHVGPALNGHVTNVNGTIGYNTLGGNLRRRYSYGNVEPNLGVTTVKGYSYIKEKFQTQQRFNDTQDIAIGFNGLKFNSATIIKSRYVPGSDIANLRNRLEQDRRHDAENDVRRRSHGLPDTRSLGVGNLVLDQRAQTVPEPLHFDGP